MDPRLGKSAISNEAKGTDALSSNDAPSVPPTPKSLAGAAAAFAVSMTRFAASGFKTVDQPLHDLRMSYCRSCQYVQDSQCSLCRCFVACWSSGP